LRNPSNVTVVPLLNCFDVEKLTDIVFKKQGYGWLWLTTDESFTKVQPEGPVETVTPVPPPPVKLIVGADVYPLPPEVIIIDVTLPPATMALAEAPLPPPPVNSTVGALV